ncbi:BrnT family toxin [[Phormidium] sp. LEGE 05292]|uniref:BrnT family toxin n=1 Tax=[Phormidium] sp. LEGE 05292 TaxID=767427 RepID=UPI001D1388D2|nr:BrnT family toxin [Phormidium sp. LEGE 05292]
MSNKLLFYNIQNLELRNFFWEYFLAQRLLVVIYVERQVRIRIISARPATRNERKLYEQS